ncbi:MAG TPA: S-methyl-5'-thioadenosine phosphorylase [Acidimicrobiales bacterium]|nr:S-methyl-5'-thioadenosine phosphorylase [Acidimicrobiales bacterium]
MDGAEIAVIGGSGFYSLFDTADEVEVDTPYGAPSGPVTVGEVAGRRVAFLPRHGSGHSVPPHAINARANLWALRSLGVRRVVGPCAVGSLRPDLHPGDVVVLDQLVDRTWGRDDTYLHGPEVGHVSFAEPYCPELSAALTGAGPPPGSRLVAGGTVVVIQGPRFSTRAESRWFRSQGWDVVNMTQYPEAYLARELGLCYAGLALVTDHDSGVEDAETGTVGEPVTMGAVLAVLAANVVATRELLGRALPLVPDSAACGCAALGSPLLRR